MTNEYAVTTNEIMDFLKENMATKQELEEKLGKLRSDMIDYMDKKFFDQRGDLIMLMRGEDKKLFFLVDLLVKKNVLDESEAKSIARMEPFPQTV